MNHTQKVGWSFSLSPWWFSVGGRSHLSDSPQKSGCGSFEWFWVNVVGTCYEQEREKKKERKNRQQHLSPNKNILLRSAARPLRKKISTSEPTQEKKGGETTLFCLHKSKFGHEAFFFFFFFFLCVTFAWNIAGRFGFLYRREKKEPNGLFRRIQNRVSLLTLFWGLSSYTG